ncbi:MAG TPA: ABC transporter substrate-binding protein [Pyrinomonadaceae bacterium]|nr:ABC transporter substrate-binding protein [Pyrinomonadaceae bacterium]
MNISRLVLLLLTVFITSTLFFEDSVRARLLGQGPLSAAERRGKQIYQQGLSPSKEPIVAALGESSLEMPGNLLACANCHGSHGQGKSEGVVKPSNLTWESLTTATKTGRVHPAYTEHSLAVAITEGKDPAGNKLKSAMPRFQIAPADISDLLTYLKLVGKDNDPGVEEKKIVIGTIVPKGSLATLGLAIKSVLNAYFNEINNQGGIYGRNVELKVVEVGDSPAATRTIVEQFIANENVFALTGAFIAGSEKEVTQLLDQNDVPLIGPLTLFPQASSSDTRPVFYLLAGIPDQARVLANFATKHAAPQDPALAIVYARNDFNLTVVDAISEQAAQNKVKTPPTFEFLSSNLNAVELAKQVQASNASAVFFVGTSQEGLSFMKEAEKLNWFPDIYLSAAAGAADALQSPAGFDRKIFISFPSSPADQSKEGMKDFSALQDKYKLPRQHVASQISTYAAAKVLVAGIKAAGKDLNRAQLIRSLEELNSFDTGLTPPITYGSDRRSGALGAYVITVDLKTKQFVPVGGWINLN